MSEWLFRNLMLKSHLVCIFEVDWEWIGNFLRINYGTQNIKQHFFLDLIIFYTWPVWNFTHIHTRWNQVLLKMPLNPFKAFFPHLLGLCLERKKRSNKMFPNDQVQCQLNSLSLLESKSCDLSIKCQCERILLHWRLTGFNLLLSEG